MMNQKRIYTEQEQKYFVINKIWVTKDGQQLKVSEMSNKHLLSCLEMFDKGYYGFFTIYSSEIEQVIKNEVAKRIANII